MTELIIAISLWCGSPVKRAKDVQKCREEIIKCLEVMKDFKNSWDGSRCFKNEKYD